MMTIAILGILISIGSSLIIQVNKVFILSSAKTQLQQEARAAMYVMTRELRQAQNQSISISRYNSSQPPCSMITFTKIQGNTVSFYQDGNELVQKTTTSTSNRTDTTVLAQDLAFMAFIFPNSSDMTLLSLGMTLQKTIYQGQLKALHMASQDVNIMD